MGMGCEHEEGIPLGGQVLLTAQHLLYRLWRILQQQLALWELVDAVHSNHCIAAHVGVSVLQIRKDGGHQGLQDLLLTNTAQKPQCDTTDVLVGMLEVVAQVLADEDLWTSKQGSRDSRTWEH